MHPREESVEGSDSGFVFESSKSVPPFLLSVTDEGRSIGGNGIGPVVGMWLGVVVGGGINAALVGTVFSAVLPPPTIRGPGKLGSCTPT